MEEQMVEAYIGIGSNLHNPIKQVTTAIGALSTVPQTKLVQYSSLYESTPVGVSQQPKFVNAVAKITTVLSPDMLLATMHDIEKNHNRVRGLRWGPRTLDLDILLYGQQTIQQENLTIPHIEIANRGFVLIPLAEIAPQLSIPKHGLLSELIEKLSKKEHPCIIKEVMESQ